MDKITFVILAAGNGSRMHGSVPKIFTEIAGRPMVRYVIDCCKNFSDDIVVVTKNDFAQNTAFCDIKTVVQTHPLGTGDALMCAINMISEYAIILYADTPLITAHDIDDLINFDGVSALIAVEIPHNLQNMQYGRVFVDNCGKCIKIAEYKEATVIEQKANLANAGAYKFHKSILNGKFQKHNEIYITDYCIGANVLIGNYNSFHGVNNLEDLALAENIMQDRLRAKFLQQGVKMLDPTSVYFSADTEIADNVTIEQNVIFKNNVKIAENCIIKSFSYLENVSIGQNNKIGPFARIRGNVATQQNVEIGNFVEVKHANICAKSKIKHLSYIGDADIGQNVNIGAGTITCNYDGKNKHKTTILDNSMIGANTAIVAPLIIGKNSAIAAGSAITEDVPDNALAFGRARQCNKLKSNNK